ncbi:hypothetical protein Tco_0899878 [Tanacetum coccineum]
MHVPYSHPELPKKLNDKISKTVDEMFERVGAFIRGEVGVGSAKTDRPSQRDKGYVRPTWTGGLERARNKGGPREARWNMGVYTPYPRKDIFTPLTKTPKEILAMESGDRGHTITNDSYQLKKQIEEVVASGKLAHLVKDICRNNQRNGNQGRNGVKVINMIRVEGSRKRPFEEGRSGMMNELTFPAIPGDTEEVFTINEERSDQYVTMGATLTTNCKLLLVDVVRENMEVFTWTGSERTAVPRFVMEHKLKIYPLCKLIVHKRRPVAPEGRLALKEKVFCWLGEGVIRKVLHPECITNAIPIKLANGTWKVQMDYSVLNKACAKDMYPLPEEEEELTSLMGYPYKCFLQLPKE